jgi:anthranilate/para-aminobenzoate synthase component I
MGFFSRLFGGKKYDLKGALHFVKTTYVSQVDLKHRALFLKQCTGFITHAIKIKGNLTAKQIRRIADGVLPKLSLSVHKTKQSKEIQIYTAAMLKRMRIILKSCLRVLQRNVKEEQKKAALKLHVTNLLTHITEIESHIAARREGAPRAAQHAEHSLEGYARVVHALKHYIETGEPSEAVIKDNIRGLMKISLKRSAMSQAA